LWSMPHLQFFPLLFVGAGILVWQYARRLGSLQPGQGKPIFWLLGLCWVLLALAGLVMAPSPGTMIALISLPIVGYAWGGWNLLKSLWPALLLLCMIIPIPFGYDQILIRNLRTMATDISSGVLDVLGIDHLPLGNVIEIPGKTLTVEAACSGIQSLYVVLAATLFFVLVTRATLFRSVMLLATAVIWVLIGNIIRLVAVVASYTTWGLDLSSGWPHELLGIVVLFFTLSMIASTDSLYRLTGMLAKAIWNNLKLIYNKIQRKRGKSKTRSQGRSSSGSPAAEPAELSSAENLLPAGSGDLGPTRLPAFERTGLLRWPVLAAFGILAIGQFVWLWPAISAPYKSLYAVVEKVETLVNSKTMPSAIGPMQDPKYEEQHRELDSDFGEYSKLWNYHFGPYQAIVSVDYPFRGYHDLTICYINAGWTVDQRAIVDGPGGSRLEASLSMPNGRHAFLLYQAFDAQGTPVQLNDGQITAKATDRLGMLLGSLKVWDSKRISDHFRQFVDSEQIQVFVEGPKPLSPEEQEQARLLHDTARERILDAIGARQRSQ